jgi:geranylgeranyl diphosphate synthase type II
MDNARIRRGKPAVHILFGESTAILAAIALLFESFHMILHNADQLDVPRHDVVRILDDLFRTIGVEGMIAGQYLDVSSEGRLLPEEEIRYIGEKKTAGLFEAAVWTSCALCRANPAWQASMVRYGKSIGVVFQMMDDLLDVLGDPERMQKENHKDSRKTTYVALYGIEGIKRQIREIREQAIAEISGLPNSKGLDILARSICEPLETVIS